MFFWWFCGWYILNDSHLGADGLIGKAESGTKKLGIFKQKDNHLENIGKYLFFCRQLDCGVLGDSSSWKLTATAGNSRQFK